MKKEKTKFEKTFLFCEVSLIIFFFCILYGSYLSMFDVRKWYIFLVVLGVCLLFGCKMIFKQKSYEFRLTETLYNFFDVEPDIHIRNKKIRKYVLSLHKKEMKEKKKEKRTRQKENVCDIEALLSGYLMGKKMFTFIVSGFLGMSTILFTSKVLEDVINNNLESVIIMMAGTIIAISGLTLLAVYEFPKLNALNTIIQSMKKDMALE